MEHPADIRHRASTIEGFSDYFCESFSPHVHSEDLDWLRQTVTDLADEVERLRRPPASIPSCALRGTSGERGSFVISREQWDELLSVPRSTS